MSVDRRTGKPIAIQVRKHFLLNVARFACRDSLSQWYILSCGRKHDLHDSISPSQVIRLPRGAIPTEMLSEEKVTGIVATEAKVDKPNGTVHPSDLGRVSYERNGECFFIPYSVDDLLEGPNLKLKIGDQVSFFIATDKR